MPFAFRCKTCGHLHTSDYAGESSHPHSCAVCGSGVIFTTEPDKKRLELQARPGCEKHVYDSIPVVNKIGLHKLLDHANWEVLADASDERLKELELTREQVEKHVPRQVTSKAPAAVIDRGMKDVPRTQDKVTA
jgi:hypothetical protein